MRHKRANHERVGTLPFGYRLGADGVHIEPEFSEQTIHEVVRKLDDAGLSTRQIAVELNRQGFKTRRGTDWRFEYVAKALRAA
jgi:hypothetical protein